jgi:tRNA U34 2-thiouridine synthase MnmA/TrmU
MSGVKAIGLVSGGLDSTLALRIMKEEGVEVQGVNFYTGFCIIEQRRRVGGKALKGKSLRNEALRAGTDVGVPVSIIDISPEYMNVVMCPKYGYGSAINPCIDCRILMFRKAAQYMEESGAKFVFTGEVMGQRPMTQHRGTLELIARESGLGGLVLRPLSAKLLPPTIPEEKGWIKRERLHAILGRSRREQMRLAKEFGISDYPQPAGGCCFLTDKTYSRRFRDLIKHRIEKKFSFDDVVLLRVGRHFRMGPQLKIIVGRDQYENKLLEKYKDGRLSCQVANRLGAFVLADGKPDNDTKGLIAAIAAWYSKEKNSDNVSVIQEDGDCQNLLQVKPIEEQKLERWRI